RTLFWRDILTPAIDAGEAALAALSILSPLGSEVVVTSLLQEINLANKALDAFSLFTSYDKFSPNGTTLALALDGGTYQATTQAILDRADGAAYRFALLDPVGFDPAAYKNSILADLLGLGGAANTPLRIVRRESTVNRDMEEVLVGGKAARD